MSEFADSAILNSKSTVKVSKKNSVVQLFTQSNVQTVVLGVTCNSVSPCRLNVPSSGSSSASYHACVSGPRVGG